jgi:hypothetical protein
MVAATIRTIFAQPGAEAVRAQVDTVAALLRKQYPKVSEMLLEAKEDITAFADFPERHWKKIWSSNPLERINREIKRRADVVQIFPNDAALIRLVTAVLVEMNDEWIAFPRRYLPEGSMTSTPTTPDTTNSLPGLTVRPRTLHHAKGHNPAVRRLPAGRTAGNRPPRTAATSHPMTPPTGRCPRTGPRAGGSGRRAPSGNWFQTRRWGPRHGKRDVGGGGGTLGRVGAVLGTLAHRFPAPAALRPGVSRLTRRPCQAAVDSDAEPTAG